VQIYSENMYLLRNYYAMARAFEYNREYLEFNSEKGIDNFDVILNSLYYHVDSEEMDFNSFGDSIIGKLYTFNIMTNILGDEFRSEISKFISLTQWYESKENHHEGLIYHSGGALDEQLALSHFRIANIEKSIGAVTASHEYVHGLLLSKTGPYLNKYFGSIHYYELPSMLMEKIFANKLVSITNDEVDFKMTIIRNGASACNAMEIIEKMNKEEDPDEEVEHLNRFIGHLNYGYVISDVYATYLYRIYLENPILFLQSYRTLISGDINLLDYFKKYNVSLANDEVKDTYVKSLELKVNH